MIKGLTDLTAKQKGNILKALISGVITKEDLKDDKIFKVVTSDKPVALLIDEWSQPIQYSFNGERVTEEEYKTYLKISESILEHNETLVVIAPYTRPEERNYNE